MTTKLDDNWRKVFRKHKIILHDFRQAPFQITAGQLRKATGREPRILCWQTSRKDRPQVFKDNGLFVLPVKNGTYNIFQGEGYIDIPPITSPVISHPYNLPFSLDTAKVGNSEMQHLDFAYATSMLRDFAGDPSLLLTIRGRKYTKIFEFTACDFYKSIAVSGVQIEVDSGYEGENLVVLVEAKNSRKARTDNVIIRQLYYPFRQWGMCTKKPVLTLFFERRGDEYHFWKFVFDRKGDYSSIRLEKSARYKIIGAL